MRGERQKNEKNDVFPLSKSECLYEDFDKTNPNAMHKSLTDFSVHSFFSQKDLLNLLNMLYLLNLADA